MIFTKDKKKPPNKNLQPKYEKKMIAIDRQIIIGGKNKNKKPRLLRKISQLK